MNALKSSLIACAVLLSGMGSASAQNCTPNDNEIALYQDWKFQGACKVLKQGGYLNIVTNAGFANDAVSSIKVGRNMQAVLCEHANFQGVCQTFTADNEFLEGSQIGNDRVSSLKVFPKQAAPSQASAAPAAANKPGCSKEGGAATPVKWVNKTGLRLRFNWLDPKCEELDRGTVDPGQTWDHQTFIGHAFQVYYWAKESDEPHWEKYRVITVGPSNKAMELR